MRCRSIASGLAHSVFCRSVITQPGTIVLTRMRCLPRSRAKERVMPCTADFRRRVDRHSADGLEPGIRTKIDDRALAGRDHVGRDGLGGEEHVAQIGGDALIVIFRRDLLPSCRSSRAALLTSTPAGPPRSSACANAPLSEAMSRRSQGSKWTAGRVPWRAHGLPSPKYRRSRCATPGRRKPGPFLVRFPMRRL